MNKLFCDLCSGELHRCVVTDKVANFALKVTPIHFSISAKINNKPKGGNLCMKCLRQEIDFYLTELIEREENENRSQEAKEELQIQALEYNYQHYQVSGMQKNRDLPLLHKD